MDFNERNKKRKKIKFQRQSQRKGLNFKSPNVSNRQWREIQKRSPQRKIANNSNEFTNKKVLYRNCIDIYKKKLSNVSRAPNNGVAYFRSSRTHTQHTRGIYLDLFLFLEIKKKTKRKKAPRVRDLVCRFVFCARHYL